MRFFHRIRTLSHWSRALLVGLALAFGLNSIVHAAHRHDPGTPSSSLHSIACGYCVSFGGLATAPAHRLPALTKHVDHFEIALAAAHPVSARLRSPVQPRAPPEFPSNASLGR